jgi:hypothetical protein
LWFVTGTLEEHLVKLDRPFEDGDLLGDCEAILGPRPSELVRSSTVSGPRGISRSGWFLHFGRSDGERTA